MKWVQLHPRAHIEMLGFIPEFLDEDDPRPAKEQFDDRYVGGWNAMPGFSVITKNGRMASFKNPPLLKYPGDPPMLPLFLTKLEHSNEMIVVYEHAWVLIVRRDGTWEAARMD